jgi:hypothetical protein
MPRFLLAAGHRARARPNGAGGDGLSESSPCLPARRFNIRQLTDVSGCNLQQHLSCNWRRAIRYSARALPGAQPCRLPALAPDQLILAYQGNSL